MKVALLLLTTLCLGVVTAPARAQSSDKPAAQPQKTAQPQTGRVFLEMCETSDKLVKAVCVAYTKGFAEGAQLGLVYQSSLDQVPVKGGVCVPGSLSYSDVLTGFMIFLRDNPDKQDIPSSATMTEYLISMYPCSTDKR
jgi:hypothetical protein